MILNAQEVQSLLDIMDKQFAIYVGSTMGKNFLTDQEAQTLMGAGFDLGDLYSKYNDHAWLNFQLGMLSEALGDNRLSKMGYNDFMKWVGKGNYIPLTTKEQYVLDSVKFQSLSDIRAYKGRIFSDINGIISQENINNRKAYEDVIREEVSSGLKNRDSIKKIISNLGHKTGDWSRDFSKSVEYISHSALNEGKSMMIQKKGGQNAKVYFIVQAGACKHCIRHYLTQGEGSQPKIFTIAQLEANGSNIGKKVDQWNATIHSMHPFCRCLMQEYPEGYVWDGSKFIPPDNYTLKKRPKVKIMIGDKEVMV